MSETKTSEGAAIGPAADVFQREKAEQKRNPMGDSPPESHPAYGLAGLSRRNGNPGVLFGSALDDHDHYITLTVKQADVRHGLGSDRYSASSRLPLIELDFSAAQFAEFITSANIGDGVPCTIRCVDAKRREPIPRGVKTEDRKIVEEFEKEIAELREKAVTLVEAAKQVLGKGGASAADRKDLLDKTISTCRFLYDGAPFAVEQFARSVGKKVSAAKQEIEAFAHHGITRLGLDALRAGSSLLQLDREDRETRALPAASGAPDVQDADFEEKK